MGNLICHAIGHKPMLVVFSSNRIICKRCRMDMGYATTPDHLPAPPRKWMIKRTMHFRLRH